MAHKARCTCRNMSIKNVHLTMQDNVDDNESTGLLVMDFKMKWEPINGRESTQGHLGKRGIG